MGVINSVYPVDPASGRLLHKSSILALCLIFQDPRCQAHPGEGKLPKRGAHSNVPASTFNGGRDWATCGPAPPASPAPAWGWRARWNSGAPKLIPCIVPGSYGSLTATQGISWATYPWANLTHVLLWGRAWCTSRALGRMGHDLEKAHENPLLARQGKLLDNNA